MSTNILMPALSPTMEEGKLAKWLVKEGDEVHSGDILAEIETDKATMEFEAVDEGKIGKLLVPEGTEGVKVNAPIAVLLDEGESAADAAADISAAMASIKDAISAESESPTKAEAPKPRPRPKPERQRAAPAGGPLPAPRSPPPARLRRPPLPRSAGEASPLCLAAGAAAGRPFGHRHRRARRHRPARPHRQGRCRSGG